MPLTEGTRLGPYEILAQIGAGGMGEVYKATDTRLNRTVAIKVLPAHFSHDPEMKQRFDREAQTVASLNHPNICTLHDIGSERLRPAQGASPRDAAREASGGGVPASPEEVVDFLVMEYLEGETLAERLTRGAMPLDEALQVAVAIVDALEKAHEKGVTHRDLKPGNIFLVSGGAPPPPDARAAADAPRESRGRYADRAATAKLLDFGLAKLAQPAQASSPASSVTSPVSPSATTPGTILGTMQYMSPEQLEGKEADARTDIFAFGAVLYEMVTGRKAFEGKSQPHLIAAIVSTQPDPISTIEPTAPPILDYLVGRCLAKDPEDRLQTATDLVQELRWIAGGGTDGGLVAPLSRRRLARLAPVALAVVALLIAVLGALAWLAPGGAEAVEITRFLVDVPNMPVPEAMALSPNGRLIAFAGSDGGSTAIFVRPMDIATSR